MSTSFFVPQEGTLPLYEQIYRRMVEEIRSGRLSAGERDRGRDETACIAV